MQQITVRLDAFEGPLDLLYHLIQKNELDIYDIPIAVLTDQYLAYLDAAEDRSMDGMSAFLVMAATLLEIKSKMLLPKPKKEAELAEAEAEDPRAELVARLLEYKKIKDVTSEWKLRAEQAAQILYKPQDAAVKKLKQAAEGELEQFMMGITLDDLYHAFQDVMQRKDNRIDHVRSSFRSVERDLFTIEDKMEFLQDLLILQPKITFFDIFRRQTKKIEMVVTFLALLEMMKQKQVIVTQNTTFGEILICAHTEEKGSAGA